MQTTSALTTILGPCLIVLLIFADYVRKYNTDSFQRAIFLSVLASIFVSMVTDFIFFLVEHSPGGAVQTLLYGDLTVYYFAQVSSFYLLFAFFDYTALKDTARTKMILSVVAAILFLHLVILLFNLYYHFYFSISNDNRLIHGGLYSIRLITSYLPMGFLLLDLIIFHKKFDRAQIFLTLFFLVLTGAGSAIDIILGTGGLIWPCFTASLLYSYFFIVRSDSKLDSLTGIGNRYSFNEFINNLARQNTKEVYSVVMIDMDHFKQINDTLGHPEGDKALRDMAAIIKSCTRHTDFAARYGGDEFILAAKADSDINRLMARIQGAIDNQNEKNLRPYKIEISYGMDVFTTHSGQSIEAFLAHIDSLMYKHKAERRRRSDLNAGGMDGGLEVPVK
jgi:diguanylate cyclase (GGDEF)-like protein